MGLDIRTQCAVCAWRESCARKHAAKEQSLHCPDFSRDRTLPEEAAEQAAPLRHKRTEDVFGT